MSTDGKDTQKLNRIETEMMKKREKPLKDNNDCFEDIDENEDGDEDDQALNIECISGNNKVPGLQSARSSCIDDILLKTLIAKYAKRLMTKLENVAVKVNDSEHADLVARLRRKVKRLLKDLNQLGGPCESSAVLLDKYKCLRIDYYSILDGIKAKKVQPSCQGVSTNVEQSANRKNCDKIEKIKETENSKKLENPEKRDNNENHNKLVERENRENNEKLEKIKKLENLKKLENQEKFQNGETILCEYCGKYMKNYDTTWEPKLNFNKENCQTTPCEWKSFFKNRFFVYFPCLCCMFGRSD